MEGRVKDWMSISVIGITEAEIETTIDIMIKLIMTDILGVTTAVE